MKKLMTIVCAILLGVTAANAEIGQMAVGGQLLYGTRISNVGIGAKYQIGIFNNFRAEAAFNYFFEKNAWHMWDLNLNAHYTFGLGERWKVYPIVGLTYVSAVEDLGPGLNSDSHGKFGLNLGAGGEFALTDHVALFAEGKFSLVSKYDHWTFGLGAMYKF